MTTSTRLLDCKARNGDSAAAVALAEILGAKAEGRQPNVRAAHARAGTLPVRATTPALVAAAPVKPQAPTPAKSVAPTPRAPTAEERAQAARAARHGAVMGSSHAKGREALASACLGQPNLSAEQIISHLATSPTDAERSARIRRDKIDAIWANAYGVEPKASAAAKNTKSDDVWARLYGSTAR